MGVCKVVKELAGAVSLAKPDLQPRHRLQVELLRLMPLYLEVWDLSLWESAFQQTIDDDDKSETALLLLEVFDFGRLNMYGAFQVEQTREAYAALRAYLLAHGVAVAAKAPDLGDF